MENLTDRQLLEKIISDISELKEAIFLRDIARNEQDLKTLKESEDMMLDAIQTSKEIFGKMNLNPIRPDKPLSNT